MNQQPLTPREFASQRGIGPAKVLTWIRTGELEAINMATRLDGPPRWRILPEAIARFDKTRSSRASAAEARPQRQTRQGFVPVNEYF